MMFCPGARAWPALTLLSVLVTTALGAGSSAFFVDLVSGSDVDHDTCADFSALCLFNGDTVWNRDFVGTLAYAGAAAVIVGSTARVFREHHTALINLVVTSPYCFLWLIGVYDFKELVARTSSLSSTHNETRSGRSSPSREATPSSNAASKSAQHHDGDTWCFDKGKWSSSEDPVTRRGRFWISIFVFWMPTGSTTRWIRPTAAASEA